MLVDLSFFDHVSGNQLSRTPFAEKAGGMLLSPHLPGDGDSFTALITPDPVVAHASVAHQSPFPTPDPPDFPTFNGSTSSILNGSDLPPPPPELLLQQFPTTPNGGGGADDDDDWPSAPSSTELLASCHSAPNGGGIILDSTASDLPPLSSGSLAAPLPVRGDSRLSAPLLSEGEIDDLEVFANGVVVRFI